MALIYVTTGPWGPGTGVPHSAAEADGLIYTLDQMIAAVSGSVASGKLIASVTYTATTFTFNYTDGSSDTIAMPIATLQPVTPWTPSTPYVAGNLVLADNGIWQVTANHTSGSTFNPADPNYSLWMPLYSTLDSLTDVGISSPSSGQSLVWNGTQWINGGPTLDSLSDVTIGTGLTDGDVLTFQSGVWQALAVVNALSELSDVAIDTSLAAGQALIYDGTHWVNASGFAPLIATPAAGQVLTYDGTNWINDNTANVPVLTISGGTFGTIDLDYSLAAVQRLSLSGDTTLNSVTNWPPTGQFGRLMLEITNGGAYTFQWPALYKWSGGLAPEVTISGRDIFALTTFDGGLNVSGSIIGQNYL